MKMKKQKFASAKQIEKILFLSSSNFGALILENLSQDLLDKIVLITSADKPKGRGLNFLENGAKTIAKRLNLDILEINSKEDLVQILEKKDYDLAIVAGFSYIISADLLKSPKTHLKHLVVHPSLLPDLRGSSPIQSALLKGYQKTGVCLFAIEKSIDAGDILTCGQYFVENDDNYKTLEIALAKISAKLLKTNINTYLQGVAKLKKQIGEPTHTKQIEKSDGKIDFEIDRPKDIYNKFRAFYVWPGIYFELPVSSKMSRGENNKKIKITDLALKNGKLKIEKVLPEGKKQMDFKAFLNGYPFPLDLQNKIVYSN